MIETSMLPHVTLLFVLAAGAPEGVGKVTWGMTLGQVAQQYDVQLRDGDHVRQTTIAGLRAGVAYKFDASGKLWSVQTQLDTDPQPTQRDYQTLHALLRAKYGEPETSEEQWTDDPYVPYQHDIEYSLRQGNVRYVAVWTTPQTRVALELQGKESRASLTLTYWHAATWHAQQQTAMKSALDDL